MPAPDAIDALDVHAPALVDAQLPNASIAIATELVGNRTIAAVNAAAS